MKNQLVTLFSRFLAAALRQDIVRDAMADSLEQSLDRYLMREDSQGIFNKLLDSSFSRQESAGQREGFLDNYLSRKITADVLCRLIEKNPDFRAAIWKAASVRPLRPDTHWANIPNSIREHRMIKATREAGDFVHENIPHLEGCVDPFETLKTALEAVTLDGLYLEFGVFSGTTINFIAEQMGNHKVVHGFDSFEGLPEDWGAIKKGTFDTEGYIPEVRENVVLHKGWFDETLPDFMSENEGPVAFLHADADLYSSTKTVLNGLHSRIVPGTIIVFDEYFNYPYWREHEYRAFQEFVKNSGRSFEYIAYTDRGYSVAVKITA